MTHYVGKPKPEPDPEEDWRGCLGLDCGVKFWSRNKGHRKCPKCERREKAQPLSLRQERTVSDTRHGG